MASPTRFLSGRQQEQKIGIEESTGNQKVLEVVGQVGIGTTIFETRAELDVRGNAVVSGILTVGDIVISSGVGGVFTIDKLRVTGISTFVDIGTFENNLFVGGNLDVDGHTELDNLNVSGVSTFTGVIDANGSLDVDGHTELDDLNVSGVSTFASAIVGSAVTISSSGINVAAGIITGTLDNNLTLNTSGTGLSGIATYNNSGVVTFTVASNATDANTASTIVSRNGSGNFSAGTISADLTGNADTATSLATARIFELTGDVVASQISFDGTGNVSLAATIQPNSVALGGDTTGDYVSSISGTSDQITVSSGTGEGSTPVISIPNNPTLPGTTVTVETDLQVNNNLNVSGNITIGGTSVTLFAETLRVKTSAIVLGFTTNSAGNEVSTDTTANNGGISVASTEGSPLISLIGAGETLPITYKKIMWFKTNAFTGLNTDAWLTNYAFGVGTTSMSAGTKFAVGNIETDFDDIKSVRHINSSGVVTASSFSGDGSGLSGISGGTAFAENSANQSQTIPFYVSTATTDVAGVSTQSFVFNPSTKSLGIGTGAPTSNLHVEGNVNITGVSTFGGNIDANGNIDVNGNLDVDGHTELDNLNVSGVSTFASAVDINADLDVDGHTELDNVNVSGVSTFSDDVRFVGAANTDVVWDKSANSLNFEDYAKATFGDGGDLTITHSSNQSSISESSGNGLEVKSVKVTITPNGSTEKMAEFNANSSVELYFDDSKKLETTGYGITVTGDVNTSNNISIAGVSTFAGAIDANGSLDVDGHTELDDVNVSGASTFTGAIDANGSLDVDGLTELDDVNVSGASTFTGAIDANGDLDVDGHTELDNLNVSGVSTFTGAIDANGSLDVDGHTELDDLNVSGVSTFASAIVGSAVTISSSGINAATGIITASSLDAAISEWVLGADGTDNYTFSGPGFTGAENDPTIYVVRGQKYNFENKMGAHPFRIQSDPNGSTGTQYNDGITNNDVSNGTLVWDVQFDAPRDLYYQCTSHANMGGRIYTRSNFEDPANFNKVIVGAATTITESGINAPTGIITASTFSGSDINVTGVVTATSFTGSGANLTNLTGASAATYGNTNNVAQIVVDANGRITGISEVTISGGGGAITVREEGSVVGTANSVRDINIVGDNLTATASGVGATITFTSTPTFTSAVVGSGVTINADGINVTGVVTATTFSGSGANLTSVPNGALDNSSVSYGGVELSLGGSDATPAFDLSDATDYPYTSLTGITTEIVGDITPQLGGNLDLNSKFITGTGGVNVTGVVTATTFSGSGASLTSIPNGALTNNSVNYGGVTVSLGGTDATPAFDLSDATAYPYTSLTGITTEILGDTTPQLGGNLDINGKFITGTGGINVSGVVTATSLNVTDKLTTTGIGISIANGVGNTAYIEGPSEIWIDPHPFGVGTTSGSVRIRGDLYVDGTEFIVDVNKIELGDFNIGIASTVSTNSLLDGAGLGIGATGIRKTITWNNSTSALMSSENWNLASGKHYEIAGTDVLTSDTLGSGIINSSLTSVGTLGALTVSGNVNANGNIIGDGATNISGINSVTATLFHGSGANLTSIPNGALTNSSIAIGGVTLNLGDTDATPAFNLSDATAYPTSSLVGTITNAQLAGSIANAKLVNDSVSFGGVSVDLGASDATPAFNLSDATNYPTSSLTGTITNDQLAGSIADGKLASTFLKNVVEDTTPQLGGNLDLNSKFITGTGGINVSGVVTATTFSGNLPTTDLTGTITNAQLAGSIANAKLVNDSVSFGGVSVDLGASDATPAFNLSDATAYPTSSLVGTITNDQLAGSIADGKLASTFLKNVVEDTTPQLGGNLDFNSKFITGTGGINVSGVITSTTFSGSGASLTSIPNSALVNASVSFGGVSVDLGASDATPAFNLSDATNYPTSSLTGTITNDQLAGSIANAKLVNDSVSFGGVSVDLGASDATPAFNLSDATDYPTSSLTGTITNDQLAGSIADAKLASTFLKNVVEDTTPQLGGNLDFNSKFITGTGGINVTGVVTATSFIGSGANLTNIPNSDKYNNGITTSVYVSITGGIGTAQAGLTTVAANNDIFIGPGIAYSFPSTAGKSYIIESIHVTNIYNTHLYLTSRHDFNGGENVPTAQRVIVPYQGALEVLEEPIIAKPSDILRFQAFAGIGETSGVGPEAVGVNNGLDSFITYSEKTDTDFIGTGKTVVTPAGTELFTSNTNPSVIQSIRLCNYDLDFDVDASVSIYRGGSVGGILTTGVRQGYLVYNLTVPKNSVIEILERPKYLAANDTVVVGIAGTTLTNSLSSTLSGKYII